MWQLIARVFLVVTFGRHVPLKLWCSVCKSGCALRLPNSQCSLIKRLRMIISSVNIIFFLASFSLRCCSTILQHAHRPLSPSSSGSFEFYSSVVFLKVYFRPLLVVFQFSLCGSLSWLPTVFQPFFNLLILPICTYFLYRVCTWSRLATQLVLSH
jgi:hypothetical protein